MTDYDEQWEKFTKMAQAKTRPLLHKAVYHRDVSLQDILIACYLDGLRHGYNKREEQLSSQYICLKCGIRQELGIEGSIDF